MQDTTPPTYFNTFFKLDTDNQDFKVKINNKDQKSDDGVSPLWFFNHLLENASASIPATANVGGTSAAAATDNSDDDAAAVAPNATATGAAAADDGDEDDAVAPNATITGLYKCTNHKDCHILLYNYFRDSIIYSDSTGEKAIKSYIEKNYNLPTYPTSIQLMEFVTKVLSEIPLRTKDSVFETKNQGNEDDANAPHKGTNQTGRLQPFWCISQSNYETKPFIFKTTDPGKNESKKYFKLDSTSELIKTITSKDSLESVLEAEFESNKTLDEKCNIWKNLANIKGIYQTTEDTYNFLSTDENKLKDKFWPKETSDGSSKTKPSYLHKKNLFPVSNSTDFKTDPYGFNFPYFNVNSLNPFEPDFHFNAKYERKPPSIWDDSGSCDFSKNFLFVLDGDDIIIENQKLCNYKLYNEVWTITFRNSNENKIKDSVIINFKNKTIDGKKSLDLKTFREDIKKYTPWRNWHQPSPPYIVYLIGRFKFPNDSKNTDNNSCTKPLPLWVNKPSDSQIPRSESVEDKYFHLDISDYPNDNNSPKIQAGALAKMIFGDEYAYKSNQGKSTNFTETNVPTNIFGDLVTNAEYLELGDWAKELSKIFNGIKYYRKNNAESATPPTKIVKPYYKQNTGYENTTAENDILVSLPLTGSKLRQEIKIADAAELYPSLKNHGRELGRSHGLRIPDQGTVMGGLHNFMLNAPPANNYKNTFKGSKISATNFSLLTLQNDNGSLDKWKRLKAGALFQKPAADSDTPAAASTASTSPQTLPANQEWCHLMGHGDGGGQKMGNLVSGSWFCNSEQLAIEQGQRETTHKLTNRYELRTTAYLFPNTTIFFEKSYLKKGNKDDQPEDNHPNNSDVNELGKTMPVCAAIEYKIYDTKDDLGANGPNPTKIFHHTFEGQGEFWDQNQHKILFAYVKYLLAGKEVFEADLMAINSKQNIAKASGSKRGFGDSSGGADNQCNTRPIKRHQAQGKDTQVPKHNDSSSQDDDVQDA